MSTERKGLPVGNILTIAGLLLSLVVGWNAMTNADVALSGRIDKTETKIDGVDKRVDREVQVATDRFNEVRESLKRIEDRLNARDP